MKEYSSGLNDDDWLQIKNKKVNRIKFLALHA